MSHNHADNHHHIDLKGRNLLLSIVLNILITIAQVVGGVISGSLSLLSDALHNFSDVISLVISYIADKLSKREATYSKTFGYKRAEILAAFVNASSLVIVAIYLVYEAILRFFNPQTIESTIVIWLAFFGILANGFSVLLIKKDAKNNMNMQSAYLHLLTDMSASVAVLFGGILMQYFGWFWVDSVLTILIAIYLLVMGSKLLKRSFNVLMLFTPDLINIKEVSEEMSRLPQIQNVHHMHIWQLNDHEIHLEAHVDFYKDITLSEFDNLVEEIEEILFQKFKINHVTIQPEFNKDDPKDIIIQD